MARKHTALIEVSEERSYNCDYDLKCQPIAPEERKGLLSFTTKPWQTYGLYLTNKELWKRWKKKGRILKTMDDWNAFQQFCDTRQDGKKVHEDETRKIALVKAVHKHAATLNTPTTISYSELEPIRVKFGVRVSRSSFVTLLALSFPLFFSLLRA